MPRPAPADANDRPLVVHGAGGHGRVVAAAALALGIEPAGFVDDLRDPAEPVIVGGRAFRVGRTLSGFPADAAVHVAIGDNATRERVSRAAAAGAGRTRPTLVHPRAAVEAGASLGAGCFVGPLALVGVGVRVGDGCVVNSGALVEHDGALGGFCHVAPGAVLGGGVRVGPRALLGLGCRVLPGLRVGADAVVGAGSVVLRGVADGETVRGVVR